MDNHPVTFAVDPLFDKFFDGTKLFYWFMPLNPYRCFISPAPRKSTEFYFGRLCYYFVLLSQITLGILYGKFLVDPEANKGDFLVTAASAVWFILVGSSYQAVHFAWNSGRQLRALFLRIHELFPKTAEERRCVSAEAWANSWTVKMKVQTIVFVTAVFGMVSMPLVSPFVVYVRGGEWHNELPLNLWLPFDGLAMMVYPWMYLVEIWLFLMNTVPLVAVESIMGAVTMLICLQFKIAAEKFRRIQYGDLRKDAEALREAIEYHNRTLDLSLMSKKVFSVSLFLIFVISSMVICIFMFLIINEEEAYTKSQYATNLVCFGVYCAVYAYYGNTMIECVSRM